jgi:hypothetical protein
MLYFSPRVPHSSNFFPAIKHYDNLMAPAYCTLLPPQRLLSSLIMATRVLRLPIREFHIQNLNQLTALCLVRRRHHGNIPGTEHLQCKFFPRLLKLDPIREIGFEEGNIPALDSRDLAGLNSGKVCTPANTILLLQSSIITNFLNDAAVPTTSYCLDREDDIDKEGNIEAMRNVVTEIRLQDSLREARPRETSEEEEINEKLADLMSARNFVLIVGQSVSSNS